MSLDNKIAIYRSITEPYFNYCCLVWDGLSETLSNKLQRLQNRAARVITGLPYTVRSTEIRKQLGWSSLSEMRSQQKAIMMYKIVNDLAPSYMADMFTSQYGSQVYSLRNSTFNFEIPNARTEPYRNSFAFTRAKIWNELPEDFKTAPSLNAFKRKIKSYNFDIDNTKIFSTLSTLS